MLDVDKFRKENKCTLREMDELVGLGYGEPLVNSRRTKKWWAEKQDKWDQYLKEWKIKNQIL
jgi:hypothetical protein